MNRLSTHEIKKIAIIGAGYLQLPAVLKSKELGYEVHCFAWKEGAVCDKYADCFYPISVTDKYAILKICEEVQINGILTIASDIAVPTVNYVAERMGLIANPEQYSLVTTNKSEMRSCFERHELPSPRYILLREKGFFVDKDLVYPLIVKPTDRSGSRGVTKVNSYPEALSAIQYSFAESFLKEVIVEEFVHGREVSVEAISWQGKHYILMVTDKVTTGEPYFVEISHHQPSTLNVEIQCDIKAIVLRALDALRICNGASHSELKISANGEIKIIEIGARMGGDFIGSDLVQLSTGYDFLQGVIQIAMGIFKEPEFLWKKYSGIYFLCKETDALLPQFKKLKDSACIVKTVITDTALRRVKDSSDRSGYLIYQVTHPFRVFE